MVVAAVILVENFLIFSRDNMWIMGHNIGFSGIFQRAAPIADVSDAAAATLNVTITNTMPPSHWIILGQSKLFYYRHGPSLTIVIM